MQSRDLSTTQCGNNRFGAVRLTIQGTLLTKHMIPDTPLSFILVMGGGGGSILPKGWG